MASSLLERALARLVESGGTGNHLVVTCGHAFFVCTAARGDRSILVEAAPSASLPKTHALSPADTHRIRAAGFALRPGSRCLGRNHPLDTEGSIENLAAEIERLFREVYRCEDTTLVLDEQPGDVDRTENPLLVDAMRTMAKSRDHSHRTALYRALLDATLFLHVTAPNDPTPQAVGELVGYDVFAAFTSVAAVRRFDPRRPPVVRLRGRELFPSLLNQNVGSILIDPRSEVGGELYRNELETLSDAVYRRRR